MNPSIEAASVRTNLEDAIIERLAPLLTRLGGYLQAIRPYNGEVHGPAPAEVLRELEGQAPAILVGIGDGKEEDASNRYVTREEITVEIFLLSNSMRSKLQRTRGDGAIYLMLKDVRGLIAGWDHGITGVSVFKPKGDRPIVRSPGFTIWQVLYTVQAEYKQPDRYESDPYLEALTGHINMVKSTGALALGSDGATTVEGDTVTFVSASATFADEDIGRRILVQSGANRGAHEILAVVDENTVTWTDAGGAADAAIVWQLIEAPPVTITTEVGS